jgi:hypothetical protein
LLAFLHVPRADEDAPLEALQSEAMRGTASRMASTGSGAGTGTGTGTSAGSMAVAGDVSVREGEGDDVPVGAVATRAQPPAYAAALSLPPWRARAPGTELAPLPRGWSVRADAVTGAAVYLDHINRRTTFADPRRPRSGLLPERGTHADMEDQAGSSCRVCV